MNIQAVTPRPSKQRNVWYGVERYCPRCDEYWPADTEFFHSRPGGLLDAWCRACSNEYRQRRKVQ